MNPTIVAATGGIRRHLVEQAMAGVHPPRRYAEPTPW